MSDQHINIHLGDRLRARRNALGMSQEAIGKAIGVTTQQVQKYEKGVNAMSAIRLHQFAGSLKVPVAYFYEGLGMYTPGKSTNEAAGFAEDKTEFEDTTHSASDRELLEVTKSFKSIKDKDMRKCMADLLRMMSKKA